MINCEHYTETECKLSSAIAGVVCPSNRKACEACIASENPCGRNKVTIGVAVAYLRIQGKPVDSSLLKELGVVEPQGPGTELKKIIEWFPIPKAVKKKNCGRCKSLERRMNKWGSDVCDTTKRPFIIAKLMISAKRAGIPTTEFAVGLLLDRAIHNARKNNV